MRQQSSAELETNAIYNRFQNCSYQFLVLNLNSQNKNSDVLFFCGLVKVSDDSFRFNLP